jgi:hypothetical protein
MTLVSSEELSERRLRYPFLMRPPAATPAENDGYPWEWRLAPRLHGPLVGVMTFIAARCTGWTAAHVQHYLALPDGHCTCRCHCVSHECCEHCVMALS